MCAFCEQLLDVLTGATRVELCSALSEGGLTPTPGMLRRVKAAVAIPVTVMVRPRCGDFLSTEEELSVMLDDVRILREHGADGFAIGCLTMEGAVDQEATRKLIEACGAEATLTFHRAIDMAANMAAALDAIIGLGFHRVLTSGGQSTALEGSDVIAVLAARAASRISVVPAGGITEHNLPRILRETRATAYHASCRTQVKSLMSHTNTAVHMSAGVYPIPEYATHVASAARVASFRQTAQLAASE